MKFDILRRNVAVYHKDIAYSPFFETISCSAQYMLISAQGINNTVYMIITYFYILKQVV